MQKARILVVDDDKGIVKQFTRALESEGYRTEPAYSGEEAWKKCQNAYFDVVITDWKMGKISGVDLARKIDALHPTTQVIIITGFGNEFEALIASNEDYHPFDYLKKLVDTDVLLKKVKQAMERRDPVIEALEDWLETNPEEADEKVFVEFSGQNQAWSVRDILEAIRRNTPWGREQYKDIVNLTVYLMTRGKVDRRRSA